MKPHIRLHCKQLRGIFAHDVLVWRAQEGQHPLLNTWWPSAARALREHVNAIDRLRWIDSLIAPPVPGRLL